MIGHNSKAIGGGVGAIVGMLISWALVNFTPLPEGAAADFANWIVMIASGFLGAWFAPANS